jgi:hypothetical protein
MIIAVNSNTVFTDCSILNSEFYPTLKHIHTLIKTTALVDV